MQTQLRTRFLLVGVLGCSVGTALPDARAQACKPQTYEGSVLRGKSWQEAISPTLDLKLEAVPSGWMIRVLPHTGPRPPHDAAELANPPYRSPTPILISTDFSFRAQDAVAWNPRAFRFFTTAAQTATAESVFQATLRDPRDATAAAQLYPLLAAAPEATLRIVDAEIVGGTANQTAAAATVASHFEQTAHTVRTDLPSSPLGALLGLRFRFTVPPLGRGCRP